MNEQAEFCDFETAKMLKELEFDKLCFCFYEEDKILHFNNGDEYKDGNNIRSNWLAKNKGFNDAYYVAPFWQQIKHWLWEKHEIYIRAEGVGVGENYKFQYVILSYSGGKSYGTLILKSDLIYNPIEAEIEGIEQAVKYLYEKK